jgi:hypothetical protein
MQNRPVKLKEGRTTRENVVPTGDSTQRLSNHLSSIKSQIAPNLGLQLTCAAEGHLPVLPHWGSTSMH